MTGELTFHQRLASNDALYVKFPLFRITGKGQTDLGANALGYLIDPTVVESAKGRGGEELQVLSGVSIPIRVSDSLQAPLYQLDAAKLLEGLVQAWVQKETQKSEQKLEK